MRFNIAWFLLALAAGLVGATCMLAIHGTNSLLIFELLIIAVTLGGWGVTKAAKYTIKTFEPFEEGENDEFKR
jgi:hypothetical protein